MKIARTGIFLPIRRRVRCPRQPRCGATTGM